MRTIKQWLCAALCAVRVSKNFLANSNIHKCRILMRRIGEPPARVPRRKTSHRDVLRPSCAL